MMLFQFLHTVGATVYLLLFLLFLCALFVPRTNPGILFWACAALAAVAARLSLLLFPTDSDGDPGLLSYAGFIVLEKLMLLLGAVRFFAPAAHFGPLPADRLIWLFALSLLAWVGLYGVLDMPRPLFDAVYAAVTVVLLLLLAFWVHHSTIRLARWLMQSLIGVLLLLALHWASLVPVYLWWAPDWRQQGFMLGTVLALVQYLLLLGAVIMLFCRRLSESEAKALEMAYLDPLTGLSNKRYVDVLFGQALQLANRPHQALAVFYIDLDKFKPINDNAGHKTGDLVLQEVARRLKACLRSTDICARIGGDEFVVIATQIEQEQHVLEIAEKLLKQLQQPVMIESQSYELGASIGVSLHPRHGQELAELLEKADSAMYQVKQQGRNGYRLYSGEERRG